jgi:hypothetical protein
MAYTLPVDSVPALGSLDTLLLQIITQIVLHGEGTMRELWFPNQAPEGAP